MKKKLKIFAALLAVTMLLAGCRDSASNSDMGDNDNASSVSSETTSESLDNFDFADYIVITDWKCNKGKSSLFGYKIGEYSFILNNETGQELRNIYFELYLYDKDDVLLSNIGYGGVFSVKNGEKIRLDGYIDEDGKEAARGILVFNFGKITSERWQIEFSGAKGLMKNL